MEMKIAVSDGSLKDMTEKMFAEAGVKIPGRPRQHRVIIESVPKLADNILSDHLTVLWLNPWDIPEAVCAGDVHCGIVGDDIEEEWMLANKERFKGYVRVAGPSLRYTKSADDKNGVLALLGSAHEVGPCKNLSAVTGKVYTRYPLLTKNFLPNAEVIHRRGAIEVWVGSCGCNWCAGLGVEIVDSGKSVKANSLRVLAELRSVSPILFRYFHARNPNPLIDRKVVLLMEMLARSRNSVCEKRKEVRK